MKRELYQSGKFLIRFNLKEKVHRNIQTRSLTHPNKQTTTLAHAHAHSHTHTHKWTKTKLIKVLLNSDGVFIHINYDDKIRYITIFELDIFDMRFEFDYHLNLLFALIKIAFSKMISTYSDTHTYKHFSVN